MAVGLFARMSASGEYVVNFRRWRSGTQVAEQRSREALDAWLGGEIPKPIFMDSSVPSGHRARRLRLQRIGRRPWE